MNDQEIEGLRAIVTFFHFQEVKLKVTRHHRRKMTPVITERYWEWKCQKCRKTRNNIGRPDLHLANISSDTPPELLCRCGQGANSTSIEISPADLKKDRKSAMSILLQESGDIARHLSNKYKLLFLGIEQYDTRNNDYVVRLSCIKCNHAFSRLLNLHLTTGRNSLCPQCTRGSIGEITVASWLISHEINFHREYPLRDLEHLCSISHYRSQYRFSRLRLDFYLPAHNAAIEFDGAQHHHAVGFFGGDPAFEETTRRDKKKNFLTFWAGINLIRLSSLDDIPILEALLVA